MAKTFFDFCVEHNGTALLDQWDYQSNGVLTPHNVSHQSHKKIWWICDRGHRWQSMVFDREIGKIGCPYCTGKRPFPGETDLASKYPALAAQWHPEMNGDLTPIQVTSGSSKEVWWICENGHDWKATIKSRVRGSGCPVCANKSIVPSDNNLATSHPELAAQWDFSKNGNLTPQDVVAGTKQLAWWACDRGHSWKASIASRSKGIGCPVCNGKKIIAGVNDLETAYPEIASQWHIELNRPLTPDAVSSFSNKVVWWVCNKGHEYRANIATRTSRGSGCPYCANRRVLPGFNDLATLCPKVAKQWHPTLNGDLSLSMVTPGSTKKVWWICEEGHVWKTNVYSRGGVQKTGCPVCSGNVRRKKH